MILDRDMFVYHCYESLEQGRSFSLVVDGLIATSAYLEDLPQYIGSIDRRLSNACQTFCVSRYVARTCRGRLKMRKGRPSSHNDEGSLTASHIGALNFHFLLAADDEGSLTDCKSGALNFHFLLLPRPDP